MPLAGTGARSCNNGNRLDKYLALPRPTGKHILRTGSLFLALSPLPLPPPCSKGQRKKKKRREYNVLKGPITRNETTLSSGNEETIMPSPYVPRPNETIMGRFTREGRIVGRIVVESGEREWREEEIRNREINCWRNMPCADSNANGQSKRFDATR